MNEKAKAYHEQSRKEVNAIRERYSKSGMYRNDGTREPLWTVDWWAVVTVPGDGVHVIRQGPWSSLEQQSGDAIK